MDFESALVVLVPEAEELVGPFRETYDPVASQGIAAHITINYPFRIDPLNKSRQIDSLRELFSRFAPFQISLNKICRFPNVIYLAPEPSQLFIALSDAVVERFPGSPPYEGKFDQVVPHLTVAHVEDPGVLVKVLEEFSIASKGKLPIRTEVREVLLMDNRTGMWEIRQEFLLSGGPSDYF